MTGLNAWERMSWAMVSDQANENMSDLIESGEISEMQADCFTDFVSAMQCSGLKILYNSEEGQ